MKLNDYFTIKAAIKEYHKSSKFCQVSDETHYVQTKPKNKEKEREREGENQNKNCLAFLLL